MSADLYRAEILQRYREPEFRGVIKDATLVGSERNPVCGDALTVFLKVQDDVVTDAGWQGEGCALSVVAADIVCERVIGLALDDVRGMDKERLLGEMNIDPSPVRLKCVLLSLDCLRLALQAHESDTLKR